MKAGRGSGLQKGSGPVIVAGFDLGARTAKAVLLKDGALLGYAIILAKARALETGQAVMDKLLGRFDLRPDEIDYCVATGYGRNILPFAQENLSEISCHGRGAWWLVPSVRTVIDGGGQDCKALRVDDRGLLVDFRMNYKCAAGTGRAVELMAESLGVHISELGPLSLQATDPVMLQKPCCILTQVEIRYRICEGRRTADIAAGVNDITARQIGHLVRDLGKEERVAFTGGIAKNEGVRRSLETLLQTTFVDLPEDPQIIGALGAALFAADRVAQPRQVPS